MALKRTNVYADEDDLALLKDAARRKGIPEAELIREGIHRMALATRVWDEPFLTDEETFDLGAPVTRDDIRAAVTSGYDERESCNEAGDRRRG
jgi:hypothetical protein